MKKFVKNIANFLVFLMGVGLFFSSGHGLGRFLFAFEGTQQASSQTVGLNPGGTTTTSTLGSAFVPGAPQNVQNFTQEIPVDQVMKRQQFLQDIKNQLQSAQSDYFNFNRNVQDTTSKLVGVQGERLTLQYQVSIMNQQIEDSVSIMQNVLTQIAEKENQISKLESDIQIKNLEIENQKKMLSEYLTVLYEQESAMDNTTEKNAAVNIAKMLLSDKPPEEALRELHYFTILEATGHEIFDRLESLVAEQEAAKSTLEDSRNKLEMLYRQLQDQQSTLTMQQAAKAQLLEETKGQESIYQQLLDESLREQAQALDDIKLLQDNLQFIKEKIATLGDKFNPADYADLFGANTTNVYQFIKDHPEGEFSPRWPVSPSRGISAYFHDESYRRAMGIPHEAIDIRALQGTPIHAPADGVVYKTRDNGYGYSYIILAHAGGFMTLYGHVSEIRVKEGEKVMEGQVIGLSGATPGTKGAGLLTTGPHLHFEVMKGGQHVDPLDYLPLSFLPLDSLPQKYLIRITGEALKVSRTAPVYTGVTGVAGVAGVADLPGNNQVSPYTGTASVDVLSKLPTNSGVSDNVIIGQ